MRTCTKCGKAAHDWDPMTGGACQYCVSQARTGDTDDTRRVVMPAPPPEPVLPPAALRYIAPVWVFDIRRNVRRSSGCNVFILMPQHDYCDGAAPRPSPLEAAA